MSRNLALILLAVAGCTDAQLGVPAPPPLTALDDRLAITGTYCTQPAAAANFPVKIVFLIDLSGSMCYTDPASGACTPARCDQGPNNPVSNPTPPRRLVAVQSVIDKYANDPAVSFSVVTFSSAIHVYPEDVSSPPLTFTRDQTKLHLDELRNIDSVTDYEGALSRVKTLLSDDMAATAARRRSELPRTKYAVLFMTDGSPFPHCSRGDPTLDNPPDNATCASDPATCTICQRGGDQGFFPGLKAGDDYNEPYQLVQLVDEMHRLGDSYAVGDLKFHSVQLQVANAALCCPVCFADDPDGSRARALLLAMAQPDKGLGSYTLFQHAEDLSFVDYDFTSLKEDFLTRQLIVYNANEVITNTGIQVDSDGDGLSDDEEFQLGTDRLNKDTDGDGYSDLFEVRNRARGFDPLVSQKERCRAHSPKCPGAGSAATFVPCDTDGDGLTDCEEYELGTDPELVDSDADGIPDGLEFRLGLDPTRDDTREDLDFDGIRNIDEVLGFSSPTMPDTRARDAWAVRTMTQVQSTDAQGRVCYAFSTQGVTLPTPLSRAPKGEPLGWSETLLWLGEAPAGDLRDYGRFRVACVRTRWVAPDVRLPLAPSVTLTDADFKDPALFNPKSDCRGAALGAGP